jgi:hypothetical protein
MNYLNQYCQFHKFIQSFSKKNPSQPISTYYVLQKKKQKKTDTDQCESTSVVIGLLMLWKMICIWVNRIKGGSQRYSDGHRQGDLRAWISIFSLLEGNMCQDAVKRILLGTLTSFGDSSIL